MSKNFFVYGTLLFPKVVKSLTNKQFKTKDITLKNYKRVKIFDSKKPCPYPVLIKSTGAQINGKILFDVDEKSEKILDFFEGDNYDREILKINIDGCPIEAIVYVWKDEVKNKQEWPEKDFYDEHLDDYLRKIIPKILSEYNKTKK